MPPRRYFHSKGKVINPIATLTLVLALLAGAVTSLQAPTNAMLSRAFGSPLTAAFISFLVGTIALAAIAFSAAPRIELSAARGLPWYAWVGGLYGAFFVAVAAFAAPKIGMGPLLTAVIAGQLLMAVMLDHIGALGLERHPLGIERAAGIILVIAGVVLVRRG